MTKTASKAKTKPTKKKLTAAKVRRQATYRAWRNMLARCLNPKHVSWEEYGGRGIKVCDRWLPTDGLAFGRFVYDVGMRPSDDHSLDRRRPNGNYTPSNVKWSTAKEQGVNKRNTKIVLHPKTGKPIPAATLADEIGVKYQILRYNMIKKGTWNAYEQQREAAKTDAGRGRDGGSIPAPDQGEGLPIRELED